MTMQLKNMLIVHVFEIATLCAVDVQCKGNLIDMVA